MCLFDGVHILTLASHFDSRGASWRRIQNFDGDAGQRRSVGADTCGWGSPVPPWSGAALLSHAYLSCGTARLSRDVRLTGHSARQPGLGIAGADTA